MVLQVGTKISRMSCIPVLEAGGFMRMSLVILRGKETAI